MPWSVWCGGSSTESSLLRGVGHPSWDTLLHHITDPLGSSPQCFSELSGCYSTRRTPPGVGSSSQLDVSQGKYFHAATARTTESFPCGAVLASLPC